MTGWPTDQVYAEFRNALDEEKQVVVIMLDEVDKLVRKGDDVLYNLSRVNSDLLRSRVSIIGISNDLKFTEFLDPRVKSSLGEDEIIFPPYDAEQIREILEQRARLSFSPGVLQGERHTLMRRLCSTGAWGCTQSPGSPAHIRRIGGKSPLSCCERGSCALCPGED